MSDFGPDTTTDDVLDGVDLSGRRVLVTGASAGLGLETTRSLAAHGASIVLAVRDQDKGERAMATVRAQSPGADLELRLVDLGSLASIRAFADGVLASHDHFDVLIANAGVMACPLACTTDGFELQFGTNHLGHFLLVELLAPLLVAGAPSRLVVLSSAGHKRADIDLADPHWQHSPYDKWLAYGRAKTANILFATEFDRRYADRGVRAFAVHPGTIVTELGRHLTPEDIAGLRARRPDTDSTQGERPSGLLRWKSVEAGAATTVWAATSPALDGLGGRYLQDCGLAEADDDPDAEYGHRSYATDPERAAALWSLSEQLVGLNRCAG
ncbi:MAG: SDR family NAD(P)-dependent oxidoreductase [Acidimicrobiia bacterium]